MEKSIHHEINDEGIFTITFDLVGENMNVLRLNLIEELSAAFQEANNNDKVKGLVFISGKQDNFIAGADIAMIAKTTTAKEASDLAEQLQNATLMIEGFNKPTVAAIHGACLGGGLELAMAFDYRIASNHRKTKFGLPEVQLGLLPGGSGTQRLPRLVSLPTALDLILTGKQLNSQRALRAGLVTDVCSPSILQRVAESYVFKGKPKKTNKRSLMQKTMSLAPARAIVFNQAKKKILAKTMGNYPAPLKIIETIQIGLDKGFTAGLAAERRVFGDLAMTAESLQLRQIFFATTELKKDNGVDDGDGIIAVRSRPVDKVGVLGAGLMGAGIAYVSAKNAGVNVRIKDRDNAGINRGVNYINSILQKRVKRRRMQALEKRQLQSLITATTDYSGFKSVDIVIEAVFEDLDLKQRMIADIETIENEKEIIFATNTSAIPIDDIAKGAKQPGRIIGMHYFSPVEKMPLLEIITGPDTSDWVTATCVEFGKKQGKTVIVVNDGPGFYTTRILAPFIQEAIHMVCEGVSIESIDDALKQAGFPVGPITLLDEVGIDVASHISETLHKSFGERIKPVIAMADVIADERKGRKNKRGFYLYKGNKKGDEKKVDTSIYSLLGVQNPGSNQLEANEIVDRCLLQMVNEAVYCLEGKILRSARDGDIGAIFGLGFPPFLGGPFRYADAQGIETVTSQLNQFATVYGKRFKPAPLLEEMSKQDKSFY